MDDKLFFDNLNDEVRDMMMESAQEVFGDSPLELAILRHSIDEYHHTLKTLLKVYLAVEQKKTP